MSDDFIQKNKNMILEEMLSAINDLNELAPGLSDEENGLLAITETTRMIGYLTALFNQFMILETREVPEERPVGFHIDK